MGPTCTKNHFPFSFRTYENLYIAYLQILSHSCTPASNDCFILSLCNFPQKSCCLLDVTAKCNLLVVARGYCIYVFSTCDVNMVYVGGRVRKNSSAIFSRVSSGTCMTISSSSWISGFLLFSGYYVSRFLLFSHCECVTCCCKQKRLLALLYGHSLVHCSACDWVIHEMSK